MSAAAAANPVAVLRRAVLLAGLLAVIAGFLGMHILSGSHSLHAQASPPGSTSTSTAHTAGPAPSEQTAGHPSGHSSHGAAGTLPAVSRQPRRGTDRSVGDTRGGDGRRKPASAVVRLPGRMRRDAGGSRRLHTLAGGRVPERPAARDHPPGGPALERGVG